MNSFMQMIFGLKNYMYEMMKRGFKKFPIAGATGGRLKTFIEDQRNASKSKRVMRLERGSQPEYVKARRFERNKTIHMKRFKPTERISYASRKRTDKAA